MKPLKINKYIMQLFKFKIKRILFTLNFRRFKEFHSLPFDINKPLLPSAFSKLQKVNDELITRLENARISDGTLLGLLRDKILIPHDNDIDFDVEYNEYNLIQIQNYARIRKWTLGRQVVYCSRIQQLLFYDKDGEIFDFIFWSIDDRFAINFSEPKCYRIMPVNFITNLELYKISGSLFDVPTESKKWLEYRFGKEWNVPKTSKSHFSETCGDLGSAWWL